MVQQIVSMGWRPEATLTFSASISARAEGGIRTEVSNRAKINPVGSEVWINMTLSAKTGVGTEEECLGSNDRICITSLAGLLTGTEEGTRSNSKQQIQIVPVPVRVPLRKRTPETIESW